MPRVSFVALLLVVASCGGTLSPSDGGPGGSAGAPVVESSEPVPLEQFPARFADAWCDNVGGCCSAGNWSFELATCKANAAGTMGARLVAVPPNGVYDPDAAGACLYAVASAARGCDATAEHLVEDACRALIVGTLPLGADCTSNQECVSAEEPSICSGLKYENGFPSGTGVCAVKTVFSIPHGQLGDECLDTCQGSAEHALGCIASDSRRPNAVPCFTSDGLYCPGAGLTCQPSRQVGQSCTMHDCVAGAFCDAGTCAPQRSSGPCEAWIDACSSDSFCNAGQCERKRPIGRSCQSSEWCEVNQCVRPELRTGDGSGTCSTNSLANGKACTGALL